MVYVVRVFMNSVVNDGTEFLHDMQIVPMREQGAARYSSILAGMDEYDSGRIELIAWDMTTQDQLVLDSAEF